MAKKNQTYNVTKIYPGGHMWTDKIVGKSALNKYMNKMAKIMGSDDGRVVSITMSCVGRRQEDIDTKDEINFRTFHNVNENDWYRDEEEDEDDGRTHETHETGISL